MEIHKCTKEKLKIQLETSRSFCTLPMPNQRNWLIHKALEELASDLLYLDNKCQKFVNGSPREDIKGKWQTSKAYYDDKQLIIEKQQVMQSWEDPYMKIMAEEIASSHGDILEVGFGMGISATYIQQFDVKTHTIIECNNDVINKFHEWKQQYPDKKIFLIEGKWQDVVNDLSEYDGIFFDTYPLSESEYIQHALEGATYAQHFFKTAASHLKSGGMFTYYSNEIDTIGRQHQRELFNFFNEVSIKVCKQLCPPDDCNYWWADSMLVIKAIK